MQRTPAYVSRNDTISSLILPVLHELPFFLLFAGKKSHFTPISSNYTHVPARTRGVGICPQRLCIERGRHAHGVLPRRAIARERGFCPRGSFGKIAWRSPPPGMAMRRCAMRIDILHIFVDALSAVFDSMHLADGLRRRPQKRSHRANCQLPFAFDVRL